MAPYATDEPDSLYESAPAPQRRVRQHQQPANDRTSAYDVYNSYLSDDNAANRQSGVGALGLGLMNMDDDDDDDDDDEYDYRKPPPNSPSKHAALAAATAKPSKTPSPPPRVIAAPQPGYAAPIAALNTLARPEPAVSAPVKSRAPANLAINTTRAQAHTDPFADPRPYIPASPAPSVPSTPHPLNPPITPIQPVFARPAKQGIKFSDSDKPIIRGNGEETLLPRRGEKGDDFWRRFSMVVKEENSKDGSQKTSRWLRETQNGSSRLSRWVWFIGVVILICIGGAVGVGYYVSHNKPDHQQPTAVGGSANETAAGASSSAIVSVGAHGTSTVKHVSPTLTIAARALEPRVTEFHYISPMHKRRLHHG